MTDWKQGLVFTAAATIAAAGCVDSHGEGDSAPISHETAALNVQENVETNIGGLAESIQFLEDSELWNDFFASEDESGGSATCCDADGCWDCSEPLSEDPEDLDTEEGISSDVDEEARGFADWLTTRILAEENIEDESATAVVYRLRPEVTCKEEATEYDYEDPGMDEDCVRLLTNAEIRVRATSPEEGDVNLALLVGPARWNPLTLHLYRNLVGLTVDLGHGKAAADYLMDAMGEEAPDGEDAEEPTIETLEGRIRIELEKTGEQAFAARLAVENAIHAVATTHAGERYEVKIGASDPMIEGTIDGVAREIGASIDLGIVEVSLPFAAVGSNLLDLDEELLPDGSIVEREFHGTFHALLAGFEGSTRYRGETDSITVTDIGFGDGTSSADVDGATIFSADLNESYGRHLDLTVASDGELGPVVTVTPALDAAVALRLEAIADQLVEGDVPDFAMHDDLRVTLDGSNPSVRFLEGALESGIDEGIQILSGRLRLTSSAHPESNIDAAAGMCIVDDGESAGPTCMSDSDCGSGYGCFDGLCEDMTGEATESDGADLFGELTATSC